MFMLQAVLQPRQLYPSPVTNLGTIGALQPKCSSFVATLLVLQGLAASVRSAQLCWAHLWCALRGARGPLLVPRRVRVYTAPAQRTPSLHSECWLSTGCPAFLALLTHHVGMMPPAVGFGTTCWAWCHLCVSRGCSFVCVCVCVWPPGSCVDRTLEQALVHTDARALGFLAPGGRRTPVSFPRLSLLGGGCLP